MDSKSSELYVLVVDDSVVYRRILQNVVGEIANAKVVGVAANGRIALDRLGQLEVDIVLLDVEMPELDGIETLKEIRVRWPGVGVVLLSGADRRSADLTMRALDLGALDFVPKADTGDMQRNHRQLVGHLGAIFRSFQIRLQLPNSHPSRSPAVGVGVGAGSKVFSAKADEGEGGGQSKLHCVGVGMERTRGSGSSKALGNPGCGQSSSAPSVPPIGTTPQVLLIGCSTGGPQALAKILPQLPANLGVPILIVQHMPPVFTASLAESLNRASAVSVCEATEAQLVQPNVAYIAPGGRHMTVSERVRGERRIGLNDEPPVNSCRPSVDVLFRSAVAAYGGCTLSVILTGMGEDGLDGVRALRAVGGRTLSQSEESCVVYGMPRAIDLAGCADERVALEAMAARIVLWLRCGLGRVAASI